MQNYTGIKVSILGDILIVKRSPVLEFDGGGLAPVQSLEIVDNGVGFTQSNRDSFDTYYSDLKSNMGGKGFGRFMYLKYFDQCNQLGHFGIF